MQARDQRCTDPDRFCTEVDELVQNARSSGLRLGQIQAGQLLTRMFSLCLQHKVRVVNPFESALQQRVLVSTRPSSSRLTRMPIVSTSSVKLSQALFAIASYVLTFHRSNQQVKLESKFSSVVLAIAVLEGVGRSLDPDCNILKESLPVVARASTMQLGL